MSVLIDGMEMPKCCFDCPFMYGRRYCRANSKIEFNDPDYSELKGRYDGCPLVPIPKHGRLIDEKDICDKIRPLIENPYCYNRLQVISETLGNCLQIVRDAPTVIEADEAEEGE